MSHFCCVLYYTENVILLFYISYSYSPYPVTNDGRYLVKTTGHKCIRINNHEHTDLQEYILEYTLLVLMGHSLMKVSVSIYSNSKLMYTLFFGEYILQLHVWRKFA